MATGRNLEMSKKISEKLTNFKNEILVTILSVILPLARKSFEIFLRHHDAKHPRGLNEIFSELARTKILSYCIGSPKAD